MKRLSHSFCQNQCCIELQTILPTIFQYYTKNFEHDTVEVDPKVAKMQLKSILPD